MITFKIKEGTKGFRLAESFRAEYPKVGDADLHDAHAIHIVGYEAGRVICCGRMYEADNVRFIIDKVIVEQKNRMQYVGDTILRALEDKAVQLMHSFITVFPTESSREFFLHEGYSGDDSMTKDLTKVRPCRGCGGVKK